MNTNQMPDAVAWRYWSKGHSSRWQLAGVHVPPDAEPLYTADQMHAYALAYADARGGGEGEVVAVVCNDPLSGKGFYQWIRTDEILPIGTKLYAATHPPDPASGEAVKEAQHFMAGLRENNWNLQSPETLAHYIADALDAVLTAALAARGGE